MKKTLSTILAALVLAVGLSSGAKADPTPAEFQQRWASLGAGAATLLVVDAALDRLAPTENRAVRNTVTTFLSLLAVAGIEAARQSLAGENGVNMGNVASGVSGALIAASWSF